MLQFTSNELSGLMAIGFGALQTLMRLNFGDNHLETDIYRWYDFYQSLTNCTSLEVFALDSNQLNGVSIPLTIFVPTSIHLVKISYMGGSLQGLSNMSISLAWRITSSRVTFILPLEGFACWKKYFCMDMFFLGKFRHPWVI